MAEVNSKTEASVNSNSFDLHSNNYHITEIIHKQRMEVAVGQTVQREFTSNFLGKSVKEWKSIFFDITVKRSNADPKLDMGKRKWQALFQASWKLA